ncbi:hypothetical protein phiA019_0163 [Aeromonas phage phiA019]|nr:hypothetical protein phiA009_0166 [Aeromonas phage phiA009]ULG01699.1 hypothetical protein phiA019_0163 [Aeromonas phage phiA019]
MLQLTKLAGKVKLHLDDRYCLVSSTLHNKLELFKDERFIRDFTNLYSAIKYYEEVTIDS